MFGGFLLALIVAIADFYFLFKKLNQLDNSFEQKGKQVKVEKSGKNKNRNISNKSKIEKKND